MRLELVSAWWKPELAVTVSWNCVQKVLKYMLGRGVVRECECLLRVSVSNSRVTGVTNWATTQGTGDQPQTQTILWSYLLNHLSSREVYVILNCWVCDNLLCFIKKIIIDKVPAFVGLWLHQKHEQPLARKLEAVFQLMTWATEKLPPVGRVERGWTEKMTKEDYTDWNTKASRRR